MNTCDYGHDTHEQVKLLPWSEELEHGNTMTCKLHFDQEMIERRLHNRKIYVWEDLKIYDPS
jgi:hypothetical protein